MLDAPLRDIKDRALAPFALRLTHVSPMAVTALSFALCVSAGVAAWRHQVWLSVALWLAGRCLDGLDGAVARHGGKATELGGYLDLMADVVGYACVPLGLAAGQSSVRVWMWCAVLLATFYVNTMSWTLLSALNERRSRPTNNESTTFHMPVGLIEGTETIVLFTIMLAFPKYLAVLFAAMAAGVAVTIGQRIVWARRNLP